MYIRVQRRRCIAASREAHFVAASHKRVQAHMPRGKRVQNDRDYARIRRCRFIGRTLPAGETIPQRDDASFRQASFSIGLVLTRAASLSASERAHLRRRRRRHRAVEPSYNSPCIMFKYYRVGHSLLQYYRARKEVSCRHSARFLSSTNAGCDKSRLDFSLMRS